MVIYDVVITISLISLRRNRVVMSSSRVGATFSMELQFTAHDMLTMIE